MLKQEYLFKNLKNLDTFLKESKIKKGNITFEEFKSIYLDLVKEKRVFGAYFSKITESLKTKENLPKVARYFNDSNSIIEIINHKNASIEILEDYLTRGCISYPSVTLKDVPDKFRNEDIYIKFLEESIRNLKYIPKKELTENIYIYLVNQDNSIFEKVPKRKRTEKIYSAFWESNKNIYTKDKENNEKLYKNLLMNSSLRKNEILAMFKKSEIYADKQENIIFPIKNEIEKIVGAYKLNFNENKKPELLENSYLNVDITKANTLSNKVFESMKKEEIEETQEIEY